MIGEPTKEELTEVLLEFHQRNQGLTKSVGPPPPFEITSTVQSFPAIKRKVVEEEPKKLIVPQQALVQLEKNFDFIPLGFVSTSNIVIQWRIRCHDEGAVARESYIRTFSGGYWQSLTPPGLSGPLAYGFNPTTWTPPAFDTQGALVTMQIVALNVPVQLFVAHMFFAVWIEEVGNPQNYSDHIYPVGQPPINWAWYNVNNGIGFDLTFHTGT